MSHFKTLSANMSLRLYSLSNKDYLIHDAVFSDCTGNFVSDPQPASGSEIEIKIRTARDNAQTVNIHLNNEIFPMVKSYQEQNFDYYSVNVLITKQISYYFSVYHSDGQYCCYNQQGAVREADQSYNFRIIPDFKVPEWAFGAVMYQIFVDRFYNGDKSNDVVNNEYSYLSRAAKRIENWNQAPSADDICNFYGGDLKGVADKFDYLQSLGVECIYLNPVFVSPSNHKYDIQDYDYVDPHYGDIVSDGGEPLYFEKFHNKYATKYAKRTTDIKNLEASNKLFAKIIGEAHNRGIKVIIDGVFNHCGSFNKWLDKEKFYSGKAYASGAYGDKASPYRSYFKWYDENWPNNDCYDSWWGNDNHPKLNYEGSWELYDYVLGIGRKWVSAPYNADGWRLDVAADLGLSEEFNHKFWRDFRKTVKGANPNALILAEHYGEATEWLLGDQWDTVMNYDAFMEPITWFLTGMEKHSEEFRGDLLCNAMSFEGAMRHHMSRFTYQSLYTSMNELSNHDHSRFLTRTNKKAGRLHTSGNQEASKGINKNIMFEAIVFQMTWPGAPTVYYGDEAGLTGWTDPDSRRAYPWGREDMTMLNLHREMIKIHKSYGALKTGSWMFIYSEYGVLSYARWNDDASVIVVINNNTVPRVLNLPLWKIGIANAKVKTLITTGLDTFCTDEETFDVECGLLKVPMDAYSSTVFAAERDW